MPFEKVKQMMCEQLGVDESVIDLNTSFAEDLSADSLDVVELIMAIEGEFDISIDEKDVESLITVGDLVNYIRSKI